jgi:hypothetical protein
VVQGEECRRRVRASAAQAAAHRDAFSGPKIRAEARARGGLQGSRGAHDEVGLGWDVGGAGETLDATVVAEGDADVVAEVDELKECLEVVVAVRTTTRDMQEQIELRRCGPVRLRAW